MSSQALYRKYRPIDFNEVEGQEHVVRTLQGALLSGRIGHAYLFCGPRGTGKTTMARLFAKSVNCSNYDLEELNKKIKGPVPCNKCDFCLAINSGQSLDMIEIDAASNRGIDEIRNIKESATVAAPGGGYKVFIVDEVHMLTPPAFNALLKILEEPPAHVIFILATTEPHKLPDTVLSRVQRFDFKKIADTNIIEKLKKISKSEQLNIEPEALASIAAHARGSLRDAESALTKLVAYAGNEISAEQTSEILGIVPIKVHQDFLQAIIDKNPQTAIGYINHLFESGIDLDNFSKQFINFARVSLISIVSSNVNQPENMGRLSPDGLIKIINTFVKVRSELKNSPVPQLPLELAVLELTGTE